MSENLEKTYNPKAIEAKLYEKWCDNKYFHAEVDRSKKPFTTVMPPPNITGKLHMGHALDNTLQDILIRYKRMQGYNALWIPGTDHAAISTEVKVTNQLKEEGIDEKELGREKFLERTWQWKEEYAGTIEGQLKKLGVSCDWDRERFTMDEGCAALAPIAVSSVTGEGIEELRERMAALLLTKEAESALVTNSRHIHALAEAKAALETADAAMGTDLAAADIRTALYALGQITGREVTSDVIERIFSRFCVGK